MDSIDTIGLFFDYEHFNNSIGPNNSTDWGSGLELYENNYVSECLAPNKEFAAHKWLLYSISITGERSCDLDKWLQPITRDSYENIVEPYLFSETTDKIDYRQELFKANLNNVAHYSPSDLEKLLGTNDLDLQSFLVNALATHSKQELKPESINYLKEVLKGSTEGEYNKLLVESSAELLTYHVIRYDKDNEHMSFLQNLVKKDNLNAPVREAIFKKFAVEVPQIKNWNTTEFANFASLLPYDSGSHFLSIAGKNGYTANMDMLPHFEKLLELDNATIKNAATDFIGNSLEKLLLSQLPTSIDSEISEIEKHINNLYQKTGKLTSGLVGAIFEVYKVDQSHFNDLVGKIVAENQLLPEDLLSKLTPTLVKIEDPQLALFLATKLTEHKILLPSETLKHFIPFLNHEDSHINILASNLYYESLNKTKIPEELHSELAEGLLTLLKKSSKEEYIKIDNILGSLKLNPDQALKYEVLGEIFDWYQEQSFEEKIQISEDLYNKINEKTVNELIPFFKEHVLSQNIDLLKIAKAAFEKLGKHREVSWDEEEKDLLIFLEVLNKNIAIKAQKNIFEFSIDNQVKFLVTGEQKQDLEKQWNAFPWVIKESIKQKTYIHIKEVEQLFRSIEIDRLINEGKIKKVELSASDNNALQRSYDYLVNKLKWSGDFLFNLILQSDQDTLLKLIPVLEKMTDYKVSPEKTDRTGKTVFEMLKNTPVEKLSEAISQVINDNHYYVSKDVATLLKEIGELNSKSPRIQELIKEKYFVQELLKIEYLLKIQLGVVSESKDIKPVLREPSKPLSEWESEDFLSWRKTITKIDDENIAEVIAVISQAAHKIILKNQAYPRAIQMISVLSLFKAEKGQLSQIATGEGKSLIVAMFAIIKVLEQGSENKRQVDIVTSSSILAMRDAEELKDFYNQFGITVSHNFEEGGRDKPKNCYLADVVYGDTSSFIGDSLRDLSRNTKHGRGFDLVIVDEVDNMFIDQNNMKVQLAGMIPGFEALMPILVYMYGTSLVVASKLKQIGNQCYVEEVILTPEQLENINKLDPKLIQNQTYETRLVATNSSCAEHLKNKVGNYTQEMLFAFNENRTNRELIVPRHLEEFVQEQLPKWLDSVVSTYYYQEKVHYIKYKVPDTTARYQFAIIAPVDYGNTGVVQSSLQWSNGLHQLLQIKHGVTMFPENVVNIFMSYVGFFNKYKGNIYGVTGTLGEEAHHQFLSKVYGVDISLFPTFIKKDLTEFVPIIVEGHSQWLEEISNELKRKIEGTRACLIVVETIAEVEYLKSYLQESGFKEKQLFVYGTTADKEYDVEKKRELQPGDIIISTNMAGRGTDLKINAEVKKNGGLHVILGKFLSSVRVEDQGAGRGARQGEPGSFRLIINKEEIYGTNCQDIECLKIERTQAELEKLEEDRLCKLPSIIAKDQLFDLFVETIKEADSPTNYKLVIGKKDPVQTKSLYLYIEDNSIKLEIVKSVKNGQKEKFETFGITDLLETIDPRSARHIKIILSNEALTSSSLNKQDHEIIQFIATLKGYTDYPEIYKRVKHEWNNRIKSDAPKDYSLFEGQENAYLTALLKNNIQFADLVKEGKIDEEVLKKAEIRKKYLLWTVDRGLYNNKYEIEQVTEYFGRWLKKHEDLFEGQNDCQINNETQRAEYYKQFEAAKEAFGAFKNQIEKKRSKDEIFENLSYYVLKAWQYFEIYRKQNDVHEEAELKGFFSDWYDAIKEALDGFWQRLSFGGENYHLKDPLKSAVEFLKNATKLDDIYSWTAHNALAYIGLLKDGTDITHVKQADKALKVKEDYCKHEADAINRIEEYIIAPLEAQLNYVLMNKMVDPKSDLVVQFLGTIEVFKNIVAHKKENIKVAQKTSAKEMIEIGRYVPAEEMIQDVNITESILKSVNKTGSVAASAYVNLNQMIKSGNLTDKDLEFVNKQHVIDQIYGVGGYVFEISSYDLEESTNGWGILLAVSIGIASIATGLWIIGAYGATSVFAATVGSSLVMQGVGDLVQSLVAVVKDTPIDIENYLKSKGMATAITLATAGLLHGANMVPYIQNLGFMQKMVAGILSGAVDGTKFVLTALAVQGTTAAAGAGFNHLGKIFVNPENIEAEANDEIEKIIKNYKTTLDSIYATDEINGKTVLQEELLENIKQSAQSYKGRFHDDKTLFGTGVTINIASQIANAVALPFGLSRAIDPATKTAMGIVKNAQAFDRFGVSMRLAVQEVGSKASNSGGMMKTVLHSEFGENQGNEIFTQIKEQGYVHKGEIKYKECSKLEQLKLNEGLNNLKNRIVQSCETVGKTILKERANQYKQLKDKLARTFSHVVAMIQKEEIVGPLAGYGAGQFGKLGSPLGDFLYEKVVKDAKGSGGNSWFSGGKNTQGGQWTKGNKESQGSKSSQNFEAGSQGSEPGEDKSNNAPGSENKGEGGKTSEPKEETKANANSAPKSESDTSGGKAGEGNANNPPGAENKEWEGSKSSQSSEPGSQPGEGKSSGEPDSKSNPGSEGSSKSTNTPSPTPAPEPKTASDSSQGKASGEGPRMAEESTPGNQNGMPEAETGENFQFTSRESVTEIDGKHYAIFEANKKTLSADGNTIIKEEIRIEAVEILQDIEIIGLQNPERLNVEKTNLDGQNVKASITVDGIGGLDGLNPEVFETIEDGLRSAFTARNEGKTTYYNVKISNDGSDISYGESVPLSKPIVINDGVKMGQPLNPMPIDQKVEEKVQNLAGGIVGSGILSIEDGQQMKEFLGSTVLPKTKEIISKIFNNPQIQGTLHLVDGAGEIFVGEGLMLLGAPTIVGSVLGGVLVLHGADQISKGLMQILTNKPQESISVVTLKESGVSPNLAEGVDNWIGVVGVAGGVKILVKAGSVAEEALEKVVKEIGKEGPTVIRKEFYSKETEDWGNIKERVARNDVPKSELQSTTDYFKLKSELLEESHIGHGSLKLLAENGLSIKDVEKFGGQVINDLINDKSLKQTLNKWGISKDGRNQFLEHTIGKEYERISEIAERAGINPTELTDIFSKDVAERIQAMKKFDKISDEIIKRSTMRNLNLQGGRQEAYYLPSIAKPKEGVIVLKYDTKKATMMPASEAYYIRNFGMNES